MPGTHFAVKSARQPELHRWVLRYAFKYSSMASSTILPQTISPIRPPWWQNLLFIPADQLLLFFTLRTGRSTTLGLPDITVPEFSHRFDESQLALSANPKKFMIKLRRKSIAFSSQGADTFPYLGAHSLKISSELRECNGCYWCSLSVTSHTSRCYPLPENHLHTPALRVTMQVIQNDSRCAQAKVHRKEQLTWIKSVWQR